MNRIVIDGSVIDSKETFSSGSKLFTSLVEKSSLQDNVQAIKNAIDKSIITFFDFIA